MMIKNVLVASEAGRWGSMGVDGIEIKLTWLNLLSVVTTVTWSSRFPENFSLAQLEPGNFSTVVFIEHKSS